MGLKGECPSLVMKCNIYSFHTWTTVTFQITDQLTFHISMGQYCANAEGKPPLLIHVHGRATFPSSLLISLLQIPAHSRVIVGQYRRLPILILKTDPVFQISSAFSQLLIINDKSQASSYEVISFLDLSILWWTKIATQSPTTIQVVLIIFYISRFWCNCNCLF